MEVITKSQAKALGLRKYFTGLICKRGHVAERFICGGCVECSALKSKMWYSDRERGAAKARKWRAENPEREKLSKQKWIEANPDRIAEYERRYRLKNTDARAKACRDWYYRNIERQRSRSLEYRNANIEECRAKSSKYNKENPERIAALARNRRAKISGNGGKHTADDISAILKMQRGKCAYCRINLGKKRHVDHVIPIALGGSNGRENLQILCVPCNKTKSAKDPIVFAQSLGMLL